MSDFKSRWVRREEGQPLPPNPFVSFGSSLPSGSGEKLAEIRTKKKEREEKLCPSGRARGISTADCSSSEQSNSAEKSPDPLGSPPTKLTKAPGEIPQTPIEQTDRTDKRVMPLPTEAAAILTELRPLEPAMPPDIQEAYDRGESVTFVKARGRWELYKVLEPPKNLSAEVRGLLLLYEMGKLPPRVQQRLDELFRGNPTDIYERLERAALFIEKEAA